MLRSIWDELDEVNRKIDETFGSFPHSRCRGFAFPALPMPMGRSYVPTTNVFARKGDLVIRLDLPGVDPARDVKVRSRRRSSS